MNRRLRHPPTQADFDAINFASAPPSPPLPAIRLADARYAAQFHVNPTSRLTPISGAFPCVYLGLTKQTSICEVLGDKFYLTRTRKLAVQAIASRHAQRLRFLQTSLPALNLCNWTDPGMRLSSGIDSSAIMALKLNAALSPALLPGASSGEWQNVATLSTTRGLHSPADAELAGRRPNINGETPQRAAGNVSEFKITRTWAERVARHPANFDGIYYRSRHTDEPCLVLWLRPGGRRLDRELNFSDAGAFLSSPDAYAAAARCQVGLAFI